MTGQAGRFGAWTPQPVPDVDSEPFWSAAREGRFIVQSCADCGRRRYPPLPLCPGCRSSRFDWAPGPTRGALYSWIVVHHPVAESFRAAVPFAVGLVELEPGLRVIARLDVPMDRIEAGMPLAVAPRREGATLLLAGEEAPPERG